ncbi:flavin-containing monooxygenase [Novosphingobium malaysiense]|uniref:Monooxygenase n=1 Tax=Novosphingobium malaysiense TaxID=1348853 RepID=A0A0B1ZWW9_9SPHN|nr:NAD(P)/FAD-dependent oxidoreductase [Novosphingobium malaysiense]KHK93652.1 monooxygenase [Novosphingobium malaysiense]
MDSQSSKNDPLADIEIDRDALRRKYLEERDRRLRRDGADQYIRPGAAAGKFGKFVEDPYAEGDLQRDARVTDVDVLMVGGGFGGLLMGRRLREMGIDDFLIVENASDFGGTWYWNRYPGVACDIESYIYMPMLEELGKIPSMRYASGPEIFQHCQDIARHFDLYAKALFRTKVTEMRWEEARRRWIVTTNRGDRISARFVAMSTGPLNQAKLPGVPGLDTFKGHAFHTSRWDYEYTGGDARGGLTRLADKRVGIIGTGSTAIQCVPHLGKWAKHLYVFQRTPSSIQPRENRPTDPQWASDLQPGWQQERVENFTSIISGIHVDKDMIQDGWTKTFRLLFDNLDVPPDKVADVMDLNDFRKMEQIRRAIDELVEDKDTAEALKPYYGLMCKRLGFSDEYLQTFNRSNATLVDTKGKGVERITETGAVVDGRHYELDCLIFATGFEWLTEHKVGSGFETYGRNGVTQSEAWKDGVLSLYGVHSRDFPNRFVICNSQQPQTANFVHMLDVVTNHLAHLVRHCLDTGIETVEPTQQAQDEWVDQVVAMNESRQQYFQNCTPGYYNNEGEYSLKAARNGSYTGSFIDFAAKLDEQHRTGVFEGLELA